MVFVKNVKFCEATCGENIYEFAKDIVIYRNGLDHDVIGKFNDVCIEVKKNTKEKDIVDYYREHM